MVVLGGGGLFFLTGVPLYDRERSEPLRTRAARLLRSGCLPPVQMYDQVIYTLYRCTLRLFTP